MNNLLRLIILSILALSISGFSQFKFAKGDRICFVGNGLADRFQHDGWLETYLQAANPDLNLAFRNLGFSGDTVFKQPRHSGYYNIDWYLKAQKANVIFMFFGYNESWGKADQFADGLGKLIDKYKGQTDRIVVFSPIAQENMKSPNFPDGVESNKRLEAITAAAKSTAGSKGVTFVDIYTPIKTLFDSLSAILLIIPNNLREYYHTYAIHYSNKKESAYEFFVLDMTMP
jgi:hypothetical protein